MLDSIKLICPHCDRWHQVTLSHIKGQIRVMKLNKVLQVAQQLKEKRGPFYDKWLAAMDLRGEQKRCRDCKDYIFELENSGCVNSRSKVDKCTGGQFACEFIWPLEESD